MKKNFCKCGCGTEVKEGNRFVTHHNFKGGFWSGKKRPNLWNGHRENFHPVPTEKQLEGLKKGREREYGPASIETRKKQSETRLRNFALGKVSRKNNGSFIAGMITSKVTKKRQRISAIKRIEKYKLNGQPLTPCSGKYEKSILDNLEQCLGYTILRQHKVAGYFLDGYCPMLNLAIEIDELKHFDCDENLKVKDLERQKEIEGEMGYKFLRIKIPNKIFVEA